ncbi:DUF262 domain-containing protein [Oceanispirochaeta crateris]|nr:DUF262 domain-containing protein [Oceanispirochaeta crateris]
MGLNQELEKEETKIKTDNYPMSIGEIINLYSDKDINLTPAFQRLYRWSEAQKTRFIESILLGIPIPPIFVSQKDNGKWDVVDGVQRLSTILQFAGELKDYDPLKLDKGKLLPSLNGMTWEKIDADIRRKFKRRKLGINILLTGNNTKSQYELFQRLNTGGTDLSGQEVRNCLLIMLKKDLFEQINNLKIYNSFETCVPLTDKAKSEEYHMELIVRYFISTLNELNVNEYKPFGSIDFSEFLDMEIIKSIDNTQINWSNEYIKFKQVFDFLKDLLGEGIFKKAFEVDGEIKFQGPFTLTSFEVLIPGIYKNLDQIKLKEKEDIKSQIIKIYKHSEFKKNMRVGRNSIQRFICLKELSIEIFDEFV